MRTSRLPFTQVSRKAILTHTKMEGYFAAFVCALSFLVIASSAVDITLENVDDHSPFSEETGNDPDEYGNKVFTKEELLKYNGENVRVKS